jgi:hypothetical protein
MPARDFFKDSRGSIAVSTIILMVVFVGLMAIVIDLGHVFTVQSELRNAADACALRGARAYLRDDIPVGGVTETEKPDDNRAKQEAQKTILDNQSDLKNFQLSDLLPDNMEVGLWDFTKPSTQTLIPYDFSKWPEGLESYLGKYVGPGIRLPTRRTAASSLGAVAMTLAQVFGIPTVDVGERAAAALSGVGGYPKGYGTFPIAVDVDKVKLGQIIFFSPDLPDVGGWTSLSEGTASADIFKGLINGSIESPAVTDGDTISLQNGVASTAIKEAIHHYPGSFVSKGVYVPNPPVLVWFPGVQVDKYNQTATVVGGLFAYITEIRDSNAPKDIPIDPTDPKTKYTGDNMLKLKTVVGVAGGTQGGGAFYGVLSTEPKLVQ